jgi:hypothetical protein
LVSASGLSFDSPSRFDQRQCSFTDEYLRVKPTAAGASGTATMSDTTIARPDATLEADMAFSKMSAFGDERAAHAAW